MARPKGSRTLTRETLVEVPARCPACGSSQRGPVERREHVPRPGEQLADGTAFTHLVRTYRRCRGCGAALEVLSYEVLPPKKSGKPISAPHSGD